MESESKLIMHDSKPVDSFSSLNNIGIGTVMQSLEPPTTLPGMMPQSIPLPGMIPHTTSTSAYNLINDDLFHKHIEACIYDEDENEVIDVYFCMYSITEPFYIEGISDIDEDTNIYGRVLPRYNIEYPCLQWVVERDDNNIYQFPKMVHECVHISGSTDEDKSLETVQFENEAHQYFLSMFQNTVYSKVEKDATFLTKAYKGYYQFPSSSSLSQSPDVDDKNKNKNKTIYVFYDFSEIHPAFAFNENRILIINDEIRENESVFSPEVKSIFAEHPFLTKLKDTVSPTIWYMCIYNKLEQKYANVEIGANDNNDTNADKYILPYKHDKLGCTAYYLSKKPLDPNANIHRLVRFACIESRIMYEITINETGEIFYMGDNIEEFKYDFEIGLLMSSTFRFKEKGIEMIGIKNISHIHRIFPPLTSSMSVHMTYSLTPSTFDKKEYL
jgi:hypothetical protein